MRAVRLSLGRVGGRCEAGALIDRSGERSSFPSLSFSTTDRCAHANSKSKRGQNGIISALACSPDANSGLYAAGSFAGSIGLYDLRVPVPSSSGRGGNKGADGGGTVAEIVEAHDGRGVTALKIRWVRGLRKEGSVKVWWWLC